MVPGGRVPLGGANCSKVASMAGGMAPTRAVSAAAAVTATVATTVTLAAAPAAEAAAEPGGARWGGLLLAALPLPLLAIGYLIWRRRQ